MINYKFVSLDDYYLGVNHLPFVRKRFQTNKAYFHFMATIKFENIM